MDVAHAILFAAKMDILRGTADYSSAKFELYKRRYSHGCRKKKIRTFEEVDTGMEER